MYQSISQVGIAIILLLIPVSSAGKAVIQLLDVASKREVWRYEKFEFSFLITDSAYSNPQWPYDPDPPQGIPPAAGISVDGIFTDPNGKQHRQPGFYYQQFRDEIRDGREWLYPTDSFVWKIRFSPNEVGNWQYKVVVRDHGGMTESATYPLAVTPSGQRGFVRVSKSDRRYFEYDDGTLFTGLGFNMEPYLNEPVIRGGPEFERLRACGINFVRMWISSVFGSAWNPYIGGRNLYGGYLPRTGLESFFDEKTGQTTLTMRIDYGPGGDVGWYDACRLGWSEKPEAIKPNTTYRIQVKYRGIGIEGPRVPSQNHGFVVKLGGWFPNCYEAGTSRPVTGYGRNNLTWGYLEGTRNSGNSNFLPRMYLALENVIRGTVYVQEVSIREDLGNARYGPEIMTKPSMEHHLYIPQKDAYALDKVIQLAGRSGLYLKLVVMEKDDAIYLKLGDDGQLVVKEDNQDGFYGLGRSINKTRWLQQAWWRYLQARWGYSPNVHSWELTNEGDPASIKHYELADEFGKFMHCRVFGIEPGQGDSAACTYDHPNDHLVTTSFWHSFPDKQFWANSRYPNVDYADVHAYVSTSPAPMSERQAMRGDAALYHIWHSQNLVRLKIGKPIVRGEAGLDSPDQQSETILGINSDRTAVWLHNFLWSGLDSGGLYELYWWNSHIWDKAQDRRGAYKLIGTFLSELTLNCGGYEDWAGTVSNPGLRVVGQKNVRLGSMHLWVQNRFHTWKNVVEGRSIDPASGDITVPGFDPGAAYLVEWWDTYADEKTLLSVQKVTADPRGSLKVVVQSLAKDVSLSVRKQ